MSAIILINKYDGFLEGSSTKIFNDIHGENWVFKDVDEADTWLQENAKVGWVTRIIDLDD